MSALSALPILSTLALPASAALATSTSAGSAPKPLQMQSTMALASSALPPLDCSTEYAPSAQLARPFKTTVVSAIKICALIMENARLVLPSPNSLEMSVFATMDFT